MTEATPDVRQWLSKWTDEPYVYLTTTGRQTGRPHRIEIWFAVDDGRMYLLSGGRDNADWVRNLQENGQVTVELGDETHTGLARTLPAGTPEDQKARDLLVAKYATPTRTLENWKARSLPVVVEFSGVKGTGNSQVGEKRL